jgi:alpha-tubulin suppressor-like RCC1 family protein
MCALFEDGRVKCWGWNESGQVGLGNQSPYGSGPNQMGDKLPYVNLGKNLKVAKVSVGNYHSCAMFTDGRVKCWGANADGGLGYEDSNYRGYGPSQMGDKLPFVNLGAGVTVVDISASYNYTCAVLSNGGVKCWGRGFDGQLGQGSQKTIGDQPGQMGDKFAVIDLGVGMRALSVQTGTAHTCANLFNGSMKCWGNSSAGQLGQGHAESIGNQPGEMGDTLEFTYLGSGMIIDKYTVGANHVCATVKKLSKYQGLKCWGYGGYGQLGYGSTESLGDTTNEMKQLEFVQVGTF